MTEPKLSDCHNAKTTMVHDSYDDKGANTFVRICTECGKPCTIASKPDKIMDILESPQAGQAEV